MHSKKYVLLVLGLLTITISAQKATPLKPSKYISIAIPEPSDICCVPKSNNFYVVSDNGILFETDHEGKIIRSIKEINCDYEAVYADENFIYAVDETHRNIHIYDPMTFKTTRIVNIPYGGGRNKGFEALTFNKSKNKWLLVTERDPITAFELDNDFKITNQIDLSAISRDISAAGFHNEKLWLLGDEDRTLFELNPMTYEVIQKWLLPVINPEGFAFDSEGNLLITCDDMQRIYYFNNPEKL